MSAALGVLHVVQSFDLGGAERMAVELANHSDRASIRPALLSTRGDGPVRRELTGDVPVLVLERRQRWDLRCFLALRAFVRKQGIRIIHSHGVGPLQYVAAALLPGKLGCRHVFHDHRARENAGTPEPDRATRLAFRTGLSAVIGVDRWACGWARERMGWPGERTFLLRNGIDTARFRAARPVDVRPEFQVPRDAVLMALVANFRDQKDHFTALRALAQARQRSRIRLLLLGHAGEGPNPYFERVRQTVVDLDLREQVIFAGARSDVPGILRACDAGVLSSSRESGPLAVLEYMAAGLPFAATRVGEIALDLPEHGPGFLVPPGQPEALAAALDALVEMGSDARKALGEQGEALARNEFDQGLTARRLTEIYRQVMQW